MMFRRIFIFIALIATGTALLLETSPTVTSAVSRHLPELLGNTLPHISTDAIAGDIPANWILRIDETGGLPTLSVGGRRALSATYVFWGKNWAWADLPIQFRVASPFDYSATGTNKALAFDLRARIQKQSERRIVWEYALDVIRAQDDVIGGGLEFKFDLAAFSAALGQPVLLPGNQGWSWGHVGSNRLEMRFSPAAAATFDLGKNNELRVFFFKGHIPAGKHHFTVTLDVSGDIEISPTLAERFGTQEPTAWPEDKLDWNASPVDLSFLNEKEKPAGKRGFVSAKGDKLMFQDKTQARFWGTNLNAYTLFATPKEAVRKQARRLSELGFNLVRLHHHDSPWVNPNIFGKNAKDTKTLDRASLDQLDWWIKCLKDEGIYVWLDLHVRRALREGDDIYAFDEISKGKESADLRGYNYVNLTIQQAMKRFNEAYVSHVNPYTGLAYKDEPAIMAMLITNEGDLTFHFGNALLPDKNVPKHNQIYMSEAMAFAKEHDLPKDKTWRSWEHGPSKIFLNDLEQRFNRDMISHLRDLGVKVPIATTTAWGENFLSSLPALTSGDLIDVHAYGGVGELEKNPVVASNLVHWMAMGHVIDKPMSVTEWNVSPFPLPDRHTVPLFVAASSAHQGWDALMQFAYAQGPLNGISKPSNWHAYNDPALLATLPAAALLYRRGDVREADTTYVFSPSRDQLFYQPIGPTNAAALRTAAEKGKLVIALPKTKELPWLQAGVAPKGAKTFSDPVKPLIDTKASEVVSDTGQLRRNWDKGVYTIDTPRTQAAMGWIGGEKIALADVAVRATTRNATVAVQSLDDAPIGQSKDLLISLGARAVPKAGNKTPFHVEPVEGELTIRAPKGLKLFKRGVLQQMKEVPVDYRDGKYEISLDKSLGTYWLFLRSGDR